jgi:phosphoenolpyruvate---glycerone phosphotransferase subunit DhaL
MGRTGTNTSVEVELLRTADSGRADGLRESLNPLLKSPLPHSLMNSKDLFKWLELYADQLTQQKDYLTELDSAIGDADHGANMHRGFQAVLPKISELKDKDPATIFKTVAMTLISTVGGASGPLYGTFFLQASEVATGKSELTPNDLADCFEKGVLGIMQRGKAAIGDKTMIDVFKPVTDTFKNSIQKGSPLQTAIHQASEQATQAANATTPLLAKKGRASYLGERSIGHQDPGATSAAFLFNALAQVEWRT